MRSENYGIIYNSKYISLKYKTNFIIKCYVLYRKFIYGLYTRSCNVKQTFDAKLNKFDTKAWQSLIHLLQLRRVEHIELYNMAIMPPLEEKKKIKRNATRPKIYQSRHSIIDG